MPLRLRLIPLMLLIFSTSFSQERKIIGRVLDSKSQKPVKNANVVSGGSRSMTFTNQLGYFELSIDDIRDKSILVSHIGFKTSEVSIPAEDRFKFFLDKEYHPLKLNLDFYPKVSAKEVQVGQDGLTDTAVVESGASFPNGMDGFYQFMGDALSSKIATLDEEGFNIAFTINENGEAVEVLISDSTKQVISAVNDAFSTVPKWIPATQRLVNVPQHFALQVFRSRTANSQLPALKNFTTFIAHRIKYPPQAKPTKVEGEVYAEFEVNTSGEISGIRILRHPGSGCGDEVTRVLTTVPGGLLKALCDQTYSNRFILPVFFGFGESYEKEVDAPDSDALLLTKIKVTAFPAFSTVSQSGNPLQFQSLGRVEIVTPQTFTYRDLPSAIQNSKTARRLALVNERLSQFPVDILKLKGLQFLDLEKNNFIQLPVEIATLTKLEELYLFGNKIADLPSSLGSLTRLKVLGLAANQIKTFPSQIVLLQKLEALDLSNNQISAIPPEIGELRNLRVLVLQNNNISSLPAEFYQLKKLAKIYLQGNRLGAGEIEQLKANFKKAEIEF